MIQVGSSNLALFTTSLGILVASGAFALVCSRAQVLSRWVSGWGGVVGGVVLALVGYTALHQAAQDKAFSLPYFLIFGQGSIHIDAFSGLFLLLLGGIAAVTSLYGIGYAKLYIGHHSLGWLGAMTNWFIASMALVLVASHALTFLFAWEIMALTSFALVVYQHSHAKARPAGFIYAIMTQIGTAFLMAVFIIFSYNSGSLFFNDWTGVGGFLTPGMATFSFILLVLGFGTKAGLVPMHMWLPEAHPQAPSHISALMSGVMLKVAVYGFFRVFGLSMLEVMSPWWGLLVMALGGISALVGVFYAIERRDMKKALAFSSIENIGIIFIGLGAAMYFTSIGKPAIAHVAIIAALLHTVNHAVLKSLLFLGAGSVYFSFHTRSMDLLGGVAKVLPLTSMIFLVGAIGLMGLPPLSVFASEWLMLQTLLQGFMTGSMGARFIFPLILGALAFAAGLAFVVFTRMFGIVFLGRNRTPHDAGIPTPAKTPLSMRISMLVLAAGALGISLGMGEVLDTLARLPKFWGITKQAAGSNVIDLLEPLTTLSYQAQLTGTVSFGNSAWTVLVFLLGLMLLAWIILKLVGGKNRVVKGPSWDCGSPLNERMQYSGLGFTSPVRHALRYFLRPKEQVHVTKGQDNFYFWHVRSYSVHTLAFFDDYVVRPITRFSIRLGNSVKKVQSGHIYSYLTYMMLALIALLLLAKTI